MSNDDTYHISLDPAEVDLDATHAYLTQSYWSRGIPRETLDRAIANSICVSAHTNQGQVGFARIVTDRATFAYLADVYTLEDYCGKGIAAEMVRALHEHPEATGLRRWMLATRDAHGLYSKLGWTTVPDPAIMMQRYDPDVYQ